MKTKVDSSKTNKKIDKLLARRTKKEKSEVTKLTNEKWEHFYQFYRNKKDWKSTMNNCMSKNLHEMDKFLHTQKLPKFIDKEIKNLNNALQFRKKSTTWFHSYVKSNELTSKTETDS